MLKSFHLKVLFFLSLFMWMCTFLAQEADAQRSRYRRVKGNMGNCIFSNSPLPHRKESRYRNIRKSFRVKSRMVLYSRCYYPKKMRYFERKGRVFNSLRNRRKSESSFWFAGTRGTSTKIISHPYRARNRNWDQSYSILGRRRRCTYCKDFLRVAKRLWTKPWKKPRKFCVMKTIKIADRYKRKWKFTRGRARQLPDKKLWIMARGCVKLYFPKP